MKDNHGWVTDQNAKEEIVSNHFQSIMGTRFERTHDFNWEELNLPTVDLHSLGDPFTEEEVKNAIDQMPRDKAPSPDGYTGAFFKSCWGIIKEDLMCAILLFGDLNVQNFHWINSTNISLLPKKYGAEEVADYRPISLIHAIARIISKMLAIRLSPCMNDLASNAQSAFIKNRSIHDNFLYVKNLATRFHKGKTPALLFKLDIQKAFDSVSWEYILDLLQRRGFLHSFRDWIAALFSTASLRVLLGGITGRPIGHGRGLRQGDPLSLLLFVIAIDPLTQILEGATRHGLLHKLRGRGNILRTSLYADDAAIFVAPIKHDIQNLAVILHRFGNVTGLCTNFAKSSVVPIWCWNVDLDDVLEGIPATRASFPLHYLGLSLSVWCLWRRYFQLIEDKCAGKLPTWNGNMSLWPGAPPL
jgi:hypothetical protein